MAFLSLSWPGLDLHMYDLSWGPGNFTVSYSNRVTLLNAWNRISGSVMVYTRIHFGNMKSSSHECKITFWPSTSNSDFLTEQTFHQFYDLDTDVDKHRITSSFHGKFATGVACQQGTLSPSDTWFRFFFGLDWAPIAEISFLDFQNSPCLFSTFYPEYSSVLSWVCPWQSHMWTITKSSASYRLHAQPLIRRSPVQVFCQKCVLKSNTPSAFTGRVFGGRTWWNLSTLDWLPRSTSEKGREAQLLVWLTRRRSTGTVTIMMANQRLRLYLKLKICQMVSTLVSKGAQIFFPL